MTTFNVWYCKNSRFLHPEDVVAGDLASTHVFLGVVESDEYLITDALRDAFEKMQGGFWSPNGEANQMVRALGIHTSMDVCDVLQNTETGECWVVATVGFTNLGKFEYVNERDTHPDPVMAALQVMVLTPHIRSYLQSFDPNALSQAIGALRERGGQVSIQKHEDLQYRTIHLKVDVHPGRENDVPHTMAGRIGQMVSTAFAEEVDEGLIDLDVKDQWLAVHPVT